MNWLKSFFQWAQAFDQEMKVAGEFWRDVGRTGARVAIVTPKASAYHLARDAPPGQLVIISPRQVKRDLSWLKSRAEDESRGVDLLCVLDPKCSLEEVSRTLNPAIPVTTFFQGYLSGQVGATINGLRGTEDPPKRTYILATSRRTGSTLLCHLLEACGQAGSPGEFLDLKRYALSLRKRIDPGETFFQTMAWRQSSNGVFGAKIHWSSYRQFDSLVAQFRPEHKARFDRFISESRYVLLRRRNKLRQAISDWRARNTDVYHLHFDAPESNRQRHNQPPSYDYNEIKRHLRLLLEDEKGWEGHCKSHDITPLEVFYEDLARDRSGELNRILKFLDLDPPQTLPTPQTTPLADVHTENYLSRFERDLTAEFGTELVRALCGKKPPEASPQPEPDRAPKEHVLVTLATSEYLDRAKQFFSSAFHNGGWDGDFALLAHGVEDSELAWFKARGIAIKHCPSLYPNQVGGMHPSLTSKYYLFTDFFRAWQTVVYSDLDAIVKAPLESLKEVRGFAAVDDWSPTLSEQLVTKDDIRQRGLDSRHCAQLIERVSREFKLERRPFCAGFFAFSTDQIGPTVLDDLKTLTDRYGCISKFGDQLILNFYFYGHWQKLNPTFNVLVRQTNYHDAYERLSATETRWGGVNNLHPYILHIFDPKPWSPESSFYLEWYSNLLRADNVLPGEPPAVDPTSLDRVRSTEKKIFLRQTAYDILDHLGPWKLPLIRKIYIVYNHVLLVFRTGQFVMERGMFVARRWSRVD